MKPKNLLSRIKACVIQDHPVFFDKKASLEKLKKLVATHSGEGCKLILFPESFIPGYPRGFDFGAKVGSRSPEGRDMYQRYWEESVELGTEDQVFLEELAGEFGVYLVVGVTERMPGNGSLYCSMLYFSQEGSFMGAHRKIKPTGTERLIWAEAGPESLVSFETNFGQMGGLICWENYMPLARMAMYQQGVQIYLAPTADARDGWIASMQHIALEGRCFVLASNQYIRKEDYPSDFLPYLTDLPDEICRGGSVVVSPLGELLAGPLFGEVGALQVELDLNEIIRAKMDFDPIGHYQRSDIFRFEVRGNSG